MQFTKTRILVLATLAVLTVAETSWAQRSSRRSSRRSSGDSSTPIYSDYTQGTPVTQIGQYQQQRTALAQNADPRRAFYPPEQAVQAAIIDMRLPIGAEVYFDGQRTSQTGLLRQFVTPPLTADRTNTYEVRARWIENGQTVEQTRQVRVTPGGRVLVDFVTPTNTNTNNRRDDQ